MAIRGFLKGVFGLHKPPAVSAGPLADAIKDPATRAAIRELSIIIQTLVKVLDKYEPGIEQNLIVTDSLGQPVLRLGAAPPSPYTFWARSAAIGGTDPSGAGAPFTSDEAGVITFSGALINIRQIDLLTNPGLANNSPTAGKISWVAFTLRFAGVTYSISAGNTINKFAYWSVGNATLTGTDAFVPQFGDFLIFTNEAGVADEAYNKVANKAIVRENLLGGLITGYIPQPLVTVAKSLAGPGATNVVSVTSQGGALYTIAMQTNSPFGAALPGSGPDGVYLNVAIDGVTTRINIYEFTGGFAPFSSETFFGRSDHEGTGLNAGDYVVISFYSAFTQSLVIDVVLSNSGSGSATLGAVNVYASYAFEA